MTNLVKKFLLKESNIQVLLKLLDKQIIAEILLENVCRILVILIGLNRKTPNDYPQGVESKRFRKGEDPNFRGYDIV